MSSRRRIRRRSCLRKVRYGTHPEALAAAKRLESELGWHLQVYRCAFGNHFHCGRGGYTVAMLRSRLGA